MEAEIITLAKVCFSVVISLSFCYWIRKYVPAGSKRLLSLLPIICLYLFIPLNFSSVHLTGTIGFFFAWLANFKLLLFAFDKGPLSSDPSISLPRFVALACLPIKIQHKDQSKTPHINSNSLPFNPNHNQPHQNVKNKNPSQGYKNSHFETNPSSITHQNGKNSSQRSKSSHFETNPSSLIHQNGGKAPQDQSSQGSKSSHFETNPSSITTHQNGKNSPQGSKSSHFETNPSSITHQNGKNSPQRSHFETNPSSITPNTKSQSKHNPSTPFLQYAIKTILLAAIVKAYDYSDHIHPKLILGMYCFHIYFMLELLLATVAALARTTLGLELEPQFKDPFMSTSLQDFWGKRWNLMVTSILRPTVYEPTLRAAKNVVGPKWAPLPAVLGTFIVSGLMHEVILYYMGRVGPTFKMMGFFVLHGLCLMLEMVLKKAFVTATWRLPRLVSGMLTVGFVGVTCFWLFLPEFIRCRVDVKSFEEYAALGALVKNLTSAF